MKNLDLRFIWSSILSAGIWEIAEPAIVSSYTYSVYSLVKDLTRDQIDALVPQIYNIISDSFQDL